jgi:hypothetical protein
MKTCAARSVLHGEGSHGFQLKFLPQICQKLNQTEKTIADFCGN